MKIRRTEEFFSICIEEVSINYNELSLFKKNTILRNYKTKHTSQTSGTEGQLRRDKVT
jgi:hypothetical protein